MNYSLVVEMFNILSYNLIWIPANTFFKNYEWYEMKKQICKPLYLNLKSWIFYVVVVSPVIGYIYVYVISSKRRDDFCTTTWRFIYVIHL